MSALRRAAVVALLAAFLGLVFAGPALAQVPATPAVTGQQCVSTAAVPSSTAAVTTETLARSRALLPLERWGGSATGGVHSRLGAKFTDDVRQKISRDVITSLAMSLGNTFWQMASGLVEFATTFSVLDQLGCEADRAAADIGAAIFNSGILSFLAVAAVLVAIWRAGTKGGGFHPTALFRRSVLLGLFGIMLVGAQQTAATNTIATGSPAWFATTTNDVIGSLASAPAMALSVGSVDTTSAVGGPGSCDAYVSSLKTRYALLAVRGSAVGAPLSSLEQMQVSVPLVMSSLWEQSGLAVWKAVQFGSLNDYGNIVGCRLLERRSGIPESVQQAIMFGTDGLPSAAAPQPGGTVGVTKVYYGGDNSTEDRRIIGWAACRWDGAAWTVDPGFSAASIGAPAGATGLATVFGHDPVTSADCGKWWTDDGSLSSTGLEWVDSGVRIQAAVSNPATRDFLLNFHGDVVSTAMVVSIVYVIVAFIILMVFGFIGLGVIVAKVAAIVMIMLVFISLTLSLIPGREDGARTAKFFKFYIGITIYAFGLQLVLALVTAVTGFIAAAGFATFGPGSIMGIMWLGFAPITAMIVLHIIFKQALGAPSPFKPSSALAFGGALAGGAAIGVGLDRLATRSSGMAKRMGRKAGGKLTPAAMSGRPGGNRHSDKRSQMMQGSDTDQKQSRRERWKAEADRKRGTSGTADSGGSTDDGSAPVTAYSPKPSDSTDDPSGLEGDDQAHVPNREPVTHNQESHPAAPPSQTTGLAGGGVVKRATSAAGSRARQTANKRASEAKDFFRSRRLGRVAAGTAAAAIWATPIGLVAAGAGVAAAAIGAVGVGAAGAGTVGAPLVAAGPGTVGMAAGLGGLARHAMTKKPGRSATQPPPNFVAPEPPLEPLGAEPPAPIPMPDTGGSTPSGSPGSTPKPRPDTGGSTPSGSPAPNPKPRPMSETPRLERPPMRYLKNVEPPRSDDDGGWPSP